MLDVGSLLVHDCFEVIVVLWFRSVAVPESSHHCYACTFVRDLKCLLLSILTVADFLGLGAVSAVSYLVLCISVALP
jgi:hypothetical protein